LIEIQLVGAPGSVGHDGASHHTPPLRAGADGQRGGDASRAVAGQDAGNLSMQLSYLRGSRVPGVLAIDGRLDSPGLRDAAVSDDTKIGTSGYVFVKAPGGKGGDGGRGGDGQPGSRGDSGRDATRYSSGGDGGPGGDGGDAGNPSDGADGGSGGNVLLTVRRDQLGLLMLVKGNLSGGDIGFAGEPGRGGHRGDGGPGGSSHHWTESKGHTDAQGKRQTRIVHHSNPGGSRGRDGRDGASSSYRARDGSQGSPGQLRIEVIGDDRTPQYYGSPFDLELVSVDIACEYEILEPDSLMSLDQIVVGNCGGMPTPHNYTIRVRLDSDRWILSDEVDLVMHRALEPGETHTFAGRGLQFRIGDYVVETPRRRSFRLHHVVRPQAWMESGIHRPFREFGWDEEIQVKFPVELMPVTCLGSLAPGESTRLIWAVTNRSSETLGHKYLRRAVRSKLELLGGDVDQQHLVFFDQQDQPHDLAGESFQVPIRELRSGQTHLIETRVGVLETPEVVPYQGVAIGIDIDLQRPRSSPQAEQYRRVDYRKVFIRISERYRREDGSRFLLVANEETTVSDVEKWTQLADYFGSGLDVWDVSYYGFLDLMRAVDRDRSLLEHWRGMTIIIPNNHFETPHGTTSALQQLAKPQLLKAADDYDINFYVVGDSRSGGEEMLEAALVPVNDDRPPSPLKTEQDFLRELKRWAKYVRQSKDVVGGATADVRDLADVSLGAIHEFNIRKRTFLFQPDSGWLKGQATRLQNKLSRIDPLHRWIIVHRYDTGDTDTSWGFFRTRNVGTLEVRRTLDASKGSVVHYRVDSIDAINENFINSKQNKHGIFLALKFEDKVDRFVRLVSERTFPRYSEHFIDRPLSDDEVREIGTELVDSILVDIFNEQNVARNSKTWGPFGVDVLTPKLNYLAERALNYGLTRRQMQENEITVDLLYRLLANLRYMARRSQTAWDSAWIPTSLFKRGRALSAHMRDRIDRVVISLFGRQPSWWQRRTSSRRDADPFGGAKKGDAEESIRSIAERQLTAMEDELDRIQFPIESYAAAQNHPGLTYDPELLPQPARVLSAKQFDRLLAKEAHAREVRRVTEAAVKEERKDLLVPLQRTHTSVSQPTSVPRPN
jgi:hypothetical protein